MFESFAEYRTAWDNAHEVCPPIPLNLDIELSSVCNLRCPFCFFSDPKFKPTNQFMPFEMATQAIDEAARIGIPALKLNWRGEPALHPLFSEIVQHASKYNFYEILVNTNGNYSPSALKGLLHCSKVMFSLDSTVNETYEKMRVGGDLGKVVNNISSLIEAGHKNIWVRRVITEENKHEEFAWRVHKMFGNAVKVSEHYAFDRSQKMEMESERTYCGYPSQRLVIASDGTFYPCCVVVHGELPLGKFPENSIQEVWDSALLKRIRNALMYHKFIPNACLQCSSFMAYKTPEREFVQDREVKIND